MAADREIERLTEGKRAARGQRKNTKGGRMVVAPVRETSTLDPAQQSSTIVCVCTEKRKGLVGVVVMGWRG